MSKYTADQVTYAAQNETRLGRLQNVEMLHELAAILRREEEEAKRDPVKSPRLGDRIEVESGTCLVFGMDTIYGDWWAMAEREGATIIRRRDVGT